MASEFTQDLINLQDAIANDSDIQDFCTNNFTKNCLVILGSDDEFPISNADNAPCVEISAIMQDLYGKSRSGGKILVGVYVEKKVAPEVDGNKITVPGFNLVNDLWILVRDLIISSQKIGKIDSVESMSERDLPSGFFAVRMAIKFNNIFESKGVW